MFICKLIIFKVTTLSVIFGLYKSTSGLARMVYRSDKRLNDKRIYGSIDNLLLSIYRKLIHFKWSSYYSTLKNWLNTKNALQYIAQYRTQLKIVERGYCRSQKREAKSNRHIGITRSVWICWTAISSLATTGQCSAANCSKRRLYIAL